MRTHARTIAHPDSTPLGARHGSDDPVRCDEDLVVVVVQIFAAVALAETKNTQETNPAKKSESFEVRIWVDRLFYKAAIGISNGRTAHCKVVTTSCLGNLVLRSWSVNLCFFKPLPLTMRTYSLGSMSGTAR